MSITPESMVPITDFINEMVRRYKHEVIPHHKAKATDEESNADNEQGSTPWKSDDWGIKNREMLRAPHGTHLKLHTHRVKNNHKFYSTSLPLLLLLTGSRSI